MEWEPEAESDGDHFWPRRVALVEDDDGRVLGWFPLDDTTGFHDETHGRVGDAVYPVEPNQLISADSDLIVALGAFAATESRWLFVLEGNELVGTLDEEDVLRSRAFQLCVLASFFGLEEAALSFARVDPEGS